MFLKKIQYSVSYTKCFYAPTRRLLSRFFSKFSGRSLSSTIFCLRVRSFCHFASSLPTVPPRSHPRPTTLGLRHVLTWPIELYYVQAMSEKGLRAENVRTFVISGRYTFSLLNHCRAGSRDRTLISNEYFEITTCTVAMMFDITSLNTFIDALREWKQPILVPHAQNKVLICAVPLASVIKYGKNTRIQSPPIHTFPGNITKNPLFS